MKNLLKTIVAALLCGLVVAAAFFAVNYRNSSVPKKNTAEDSEASAPTSGVLNTVTAEKNENIATQDNVSDVYENVIPAIVSINVVSTENEYDFFGRKYSYDVKGAGTGIIVAQDYEDILIATNNHVVKNCKSINVTFVDGESVKATVRGTEEEFDLAIIEVSLRKIPSATLSAIRVATLGSSDSLQLGEMVVAIGNALGYGQSATVGHVSALNRKVEAEDGFNVELIQTDTAINPGNSGGALINMYGEVVGINNMKIAETGVEGVCYAIPISTAIPVIEDLMTRVELSGKEQANIGIVGQVVSEEVAAALNMPRGIYVKSVKSGSAAETAGITEGMIITKINNRAVTSEESYEKILSYTRGGSKGTVTVKVLDKGKYVEQEIEIVFDYKKGK